MASNDWTCAPREHEFVEVGRFTIDGTPEPARLFCRRCGWVREIPAGRGDPPPTPDKRD